METSQYDEIIKTIGDFGPYQKVTFFIFCLPAAIKATVIMSSVFILSLPEYRCALPGYPNDTYSVQSAVHEDLIKSTIPLTTRQHENAYVQCSIFNINTTSVANNSSKRIQTDCDKWVYESSESPSSISMEYDLVCSHRAMRSHINMGFFAGSLVGSVLFGFLADKFGRKLSLLLCISLQAVCGVCSYFVYPLYAVVLVRSLQGMTLPMFSISASIGMELVGPSKRTFAGVGVEFFWAGGLFLVPFVYYIAGDWRTYQLVFGVTSLILVGAICFLPESPRWLIDRGDIEKAEKIFLKIAKSNKKSWSKDCLQMESAHRSTDKVSVSRLLKNKAVLIRTLIILLNWFAVNFLYYGLSFNLDNLSGSLYVNYILSAAVEVVAFVLCYAILSRIGRKTCYFVAMLLGAIACFLVIFPTLYDNGAHGWTIIMLAMIGKLSSAVTYTILYIITVELFPTTARNSVLGLCSVFENTGGLISPYIADLGVFVGGSLETALPSIVFGSITLIAGIMSLALPETKDQPLPETIEDILMDKNKKIIK